MLSCGGIHGILHIIFSFVRVRSFSVVGYVNRGGGISQSELYHRTVQKPKKCTYYDVDVFGSR